LDVHKQVPLRNKLAKTIKGINAPIIVDSIRDIVDIDRNALDGRPLITWFVDCNDTIIRQRLEKRSTIGEKRLNSASPVDRTATIIRNVADQIVANFGSLEELRWRIDDQLFKVLSIHH